MALLLYVPLSIRDKPLSPPTQVISLLYHQELVSWKEMVFPISMGHPAQHYELGIALPTQQKDL